MVLTLVLTLMEVGGLKHSLIEAHDLATSSTSNLEKHNAKHQAEVENLTVCI